MGARMLAAGNNRGLGRSGFGVVQPHPRSRAHAVPGAEAHKRDKKAETHIREIVAKQIACNMLVNTITGEAAAAELGMTSMQAIVAGTVRWRTLLQISGGVGQIGQVGVVHEDQ